MTLTKKIILVVDDNPTNISLLGSILGESYKIKAALNGAEALLIATKDPVPDLILLDVMMPDMDGFEVCARLKENPLTSAIPIIFVTAMSEPEHERAGLDLGAVDYIQKPFSPPIIEARVRTHMALHDVNVSLEQKVRERTQELMDIKMEIIHRLARAAEFRDEETGNHILRMSHYARLLAKALKCNDAWVELIFNAAPMHDVGKIGIPDRVLLKPGKLDPEEWEIMKKHAAYGADILGNHPSDIIQMSCEIALTHHEKWNGTGYPNGLAGNDIPLSGQIVAIADVFDALTSARPYKKAWLVDDAVAFIVSQRDIHFSSQMVDAFLATLPDILVVKSKFADE